MWQSKVIGRGHFFAHVFILICLGSAPVIQAEDAVRMLPIEASSPQESLRLKIFGESKALRLCTSLSTEPEIKIGADGKLEAISREILDLIKKSDASRLKDFFHPKLKVTKFQVMKSLSTLKDITGKAQSISNYRIFALNSPDGSTSAIPCLNDGVSIHPLYGYPLSVALWFQASGDQNIARIFFELVPYKDIWKIGAWHVQQWTHAGQDFEAWYEKAASEFDKKNLISAYLHAEMTERLLDGGGFLSFPIVNDVTQLKTKTITKETFQETVQKIFSSEVLRYASPIFVDSGIGLVLRFETKSDIALATIRENCTKYLTKVKLEPWGRAIGALRCGYILPREASERDGILGSILVEEPSPPTTKVPASK